MEVISAYDLYTNKAKRPKNTNSLYGQNLFQPLQFLPEKDKTFEWACQNIDWSEFDGLTQIRARANWMMKNYKLAVGEIEHSDYIKQDNEYADMIDAMEKQANKPVEAMQLKFFPLANTAVNVLVDEFSKRISHMTFDDVSPVAYNERLEEKKKEVEQRLMMDAWIKQQQKLVEMGLPSDSEQAQQMTSMESIRSLPEIQEFYTKSYRNIYQDWAQHQMDADTRRFALNELERRQFRNMLITDREFWHFRMMESDYEIEAWNPPQVFYRKSPGSRYIADGSRVGYIEYLTIPDIIDMDGYKMSEEQILTLNRIMGARGSQYAIDGLMPDNYWDSTQSWDWNRTGPGLGMRQAMSVLDNALGVNGYSGDVVKNIVNESEDIFNQFGEYLLRRTTVYWKTQRKYYQLSKIDELGNYYTEIVGENYKVTTKPLYNETVYKGKNKENLIYGEHLDPLWANEVWGGIRIGTNVPSVGWQSPSSSVFTPIYLGINGGKPGRIPFQFKADNNIYGCKLPVEGAVFTDYNTKSRAFVDNLKPFQIGYNMSMNMLQDTMVNDLGVLLQLDPNALMKHSIGNDYGPDTLQSAITIARDLSIIPAYSSGKNADGEHIGAHPIQRLDLSQTERLMGLAKLADFFRTAGLDSVGLNPRRLGTPIDKEDTATGVQQQVAASYSHTEYLFTQHCDELMPRVHQMRTDLAQYYNCTNPSVRLQYITDNDILAWFEVDGTRLLGREFNIRCTTQVNARQMIMKIQQLLLTNNTSGANLYDLVRGMQIDTVSEMNQFMKQLEQRSIQEKQQEQQQEQQLAQQEQEYQAQKEREQREFESSENEKDRQADIYKAEINSAAKAASAKPPSEGEAAYQKGLDRIEQQSNFRETMNLDREKHLTQTRLQQENLQVQRQKIAAEKDRSDAMLRVAKVNKKQKEKEKK